MRWFEFKSRPLRTTIPVLILTAVICIPGFAATGNEGTDADPVEPAVYTKFQDSPGGTVYVIVLLEKPPAAKNATPDGRRQAVKQVQDRVLEKLAPGEFSIVHKYQNFASMTGHVNAAGLDKLAADPQVRGVGLDVGGHGHLDVSVPFIGADQVQTQLALGYTGEGITVAVLDSGIDSGHRDLKDNIADGWYHFLKDDYGPGAEDDHGHGTNVAGIITSAGYTAPLGVAPDADILPIKVLDCNNYFDSTSDIAAAVDYVVTHLNDYDNLCVMNMSLGTDPNFSECPCDDVDLRWLENLKDSLDAAKNVGIVIFASSGNSGFTSRMPAPACLSAVTAVAAVYDQDLGREPNSGNYTCGCNDDTTHADLITCFSNRNGCNELAAPGRHITAPGRGGGTSTYTGTSQASPHCAGVAALMHEKAEYLRMWTSPAWIVQTMKDTGVPTTDPAMTSPNPIRVDAFAAVNQFIEPWAGFKWKQAPNTGGHGISIACDRYDNPGPAVQRNIADDFLCTTTGPITAFVLFASFENDNKNTIGRIHLSIYDDDPDANQPGNLLWEKDFYSADDDFTESLYYTISPMTYPSRAWWWDPAGGEEPLSANHKKTWRYDIPVDPTEAFVQQGDPCEPVVYWLGVHAYFGGFIPWPSDPGFGWRTSLLSEGFNNAAVHSNDDGSTWNKLIYPADHASANENIDMAFKIFGNICCSCPDYNTDTTINFEDFPHFAEGWGWTGPSGGDDSSRDLNCDGSVDYKDVSILARLWLDACIDECRGCF